MKTDNQQSCAQTEMMCLKFTRSSRNQRQSSTIIQELCHEFSLEELVKSTNNFDGSRIVGRGVFGPVYKGCLQHHDGATDHTIVALKRAREKSNQSIYNNEIELLCQLRHPNLVSLIGFCKHKNEKIIVYEYASNGSLDRYLLSVARSWKKSLEICIGIARGLHYLHAGAKRTIIHRKIKSSSILLDHAMIPKLTGFGRSVQGARFMSKPKPIQTDNIPGNLGYLPPECLSQLTFSDKSDVCSFGIVLLQVVYGTAVMKILDKKFDPVEENIDPNIKGKIAPQCWQVFMDITQRCLTYEPEERPTMGEVEAQLEHALSLQEEADIQNTNGDYTLSSKTIITRGREQELDHALPLLEEADVIKTNDDYSSFNSIPNTEYSYVEDNDVEDKFSR